MEIEKYHLKQMQALPLEAKIIKSQQRIKEWYDYWDGQVCIAFSGGIDSTVLLDVVRSVYPNVVAVFSNTGLEYPEIVGFVKTFDNIEIVRPKKSFKEVVNEYGYPVVSKRTARFVRDLQNPTDKNEATRNLRLTGYTKKGQFQPTMKISKKWLKLVDAPFKVSEQCCHFIKTDPLRSFTKKNDLKSFVGSMASESNARENDFVRLGGCNVFNLKDPISTPLGFWTQQDVYQYIIQKDLPYCSVYGDIVEDKNGILTTTGEKRTGCMFCMFGVHLEKGENRFQRMKKTHPKLWEYCIYKLNLKQVLDYIGVKYE